MAWRPHSFSSAARPTRSRMPPATDAQNIASEIAAQTTTGATKAVLLNAGDALVFDQNDNHIRDAQERVLVSATAGKAIVFLSDGFGPTAGAFDQNEVSGLSVSNSFRGVVHTDVNGSITTTIDSAGQFTPTTLQNASIAGLTVDGRVFGDLIAGKNISNVRIGSGLFTSTAEQSVSDILLGTAADQDDVRYAFLGNPFTLSFTQPPARMAAASRTFAWQTARPTSKQATADGSQRKAVMAVPAAVSLDSSSPTRRRASRHNGYGRIFGSRQRRARRRSAPKLDLISHQLHGFRDILAWPGR